MIYHKLTGPDRHDINILRTGLGNRRGLESERNAARSLKGSYEDSYNGY
jgi:hypothetical protein